MGPDIVVGTGAYEFAFQHRRGKARSDAALRCAWLRGEYIFQPVLDEFGEIASVHLRTSTGFYSQAACDTAPDRCADLGFADAQFAFETSQCKRIGDRRFIDLTMLDLVFQAHQLQHDNDVLASHIPPFVRCPGTKDTWSLEAEFVKCQIVGDSQLKRSNLTDGRVVAHFVCQRSLSTRLTPFERGTGWIGLQKTSHSKPITSSTAAAANAVMKGPPSYHRSQSAVQMAADTPDGMKRHRDAGFDIEEFQVS